MAFESETIRLAHSVLFLLIALFILLASPAHAALSCGMTYPGTGTCSKGATGITSVDCGNLAEGCCGAVPGCQWKASNTGEFFCAGNPSFTCSTFDGNPDACGQVGCDWQPYNPAAGPCTGSINGEGYGEACSASKPCASCLVCDPVAHKCAQRAGICTLNPAVYVQPPLNYSAFPGALSPTGAIENLTEGSQGGRGGSVVGSSSGFYKVGWFSDWRSMGLIGVAMVCSIIAIAAMVGTAFNLPEVKAFANNELKQAVISAVLIVSLIALIAFFDQIAAYSIQASDLPVPCSGAEPCYITAAKFYLTTLYDTGSQFAEDNLAESIAKMKRSTLGYNINMNKIYFAFAGFSIRFNAGESLVAERHGALFSQVSKILTSIYAQKYFIDVITFGVAPLFLLLGIVLRTFFFTRKLGGLLLAIAISLFIVYPLTYAFAWYTLNVTVYGERTFAVADPNCPGECTATYPVAFFSNATSGELIQFPTTQAIVRAGINASNWNTGGPDISGDSVPDFPGLVACRNLSAIGIGSSIAPNSCSDCPDYCRDVPFPTNMPGCNITKCSTCNPGCKVVRQRLNCNADPACPVGQCPLKCRTQTPVENKCFDNESGGIIAANLSVDCSGCDKFPAWCRFLYENSTGGLTRVYNDTRLDPQCVGVDNPAICPSQCSYITQIGTDASCDSICSVKSASGARIVCPKQCRVADLFNSTWASTYDTAPPNFTSACSNTPDIAAACKACTDHPECMSPTLQVSQLSVHNCAAYPTTSDHAEKCLDCPEYCRRTDFNIFSSYPTGSNVERDGTNLPKVCDSGAYPSINCSASGSPPACAATCNAAGAPIICRPYSSLSATDGDIAACRGCPDNARFKVRYTKQDSTYNCVNGVPTTMNTAPAQSSAATLAGEGTIASDGEIGLAGAGRSVRLDSQPSMTVSVDDVHIDPSPAYLGATLSGHCTATAQASIIQAGARRPGTAYLDKSGAILFSGSISYNYIWYKNGAMWSSGTAPSAGSSGEDVAVAMMGNLVKNDVWAFSCQASDGGVTSAWMNSSDDTVLGNQPEAPCTVTNAGINLTTGYSCSNTDCPEATCQAHPIYVDLPNEKAFPDCGDASTTGCPYGCRVLGLDGSLNPDCAALCSSLPSHCFVQQPSSVPVCSEYLGNGPASCHGLLCTTLADQSSCTAQGCSWDSNSQYCDLPACKAITSGKQACTSNPDCSWMPTDSIIKIEDRSGDYGLRDACRQCPEECRLNSTSGLYEGNCGVKGNGNGNFVDCSETACPEACRVSEPSLPAQPDCQPYNDQSGLACAGCPALCRRSGALLSVVSTCPQDKCMPDADPSKGCTSVCQQPDPPDKVCQGCFDCDFDCTYYPAIRTDCSDICSDEALAGPVSVSPDDFIKKLPGASTSADGMWARQIGVLYIPGVLLPLFCIVMVVAFVRILSPVLGGDIEIPGIGKII